MERARDCQLFMTTEDEKIFCEALRAFNPNIYFLDTKPSFEADIDKRLVDDVTKLNSEFFSIVNFDLINKNELANSYEKHSNYFHFFQLGRAQMQFLRSHPDINVKGCLQHGRIADSYDKEDEEEKKWKNKVYSILKKLGHKVYWYYTLPDGTREIASKPQNNLVALPDAIKKYNGKSGNFMIHSRAKFVPDGISIDDLPKTDNV
jgi:hypothetical protein